jgi:hypothetical protein
VRTRALGKEISVSNSSSRLPVHPSLEQLQKQAKELLKQHRAEVKAALD